MPARTAVAPSFTESSPSARLPVPRPVRRDLGAIKQGAGRGSGAEASCAGERAAHKEAGGEGAAA
eukprot:scaffold966_cov415-Prasinococcus_capsulatus_cf.AAC.14